jgi:hypothetical protein
MALLAMSVSMVSAKPTSVAPAAAQSNHSDDTHDSLNTDAPIGKN